MIDLSYLTEEEQEAIMTVLKRDAELKKAEEDRVKQLQSLLCGGSQLKYMTGEWFYEVKSQRHQDRIHGSEIIWASMRQKRPDFTRSLERPRCGSGLDDATRGSGQTGVSQEQKDRGGSVSSEGCQETTKMAMRSPKIPRHNPFNTVPVEFDPEKTYSQLSNGTQAHRSTQQAESSYTQMAQRDPLSSGADPEVLVKRPAPIPRKRTKPPRTQSSQTESSGSGVTTPTTSTASSTTGIPKQALISNLPETHRRSDNFAAEPRANFAAKPFNERREGAGPEAESEFAERSKEQRSLQRQDKWEERDQDQTGLSISDGGRERENIPGSSEGQQRETTFWSHAGQCREAASRSEDSQKRETKAWLKESEQRENVSRSPEVLQEEAPARSSVLQQRNISPHAHEDTQAEASKARFNEVHQREGITRLNEGHRIQASYWSNAGHQRETPPQTDWPNHEGGRGQGLAVSSSPEEWNLSERKAQQLPSPPGSGVARPSWPPSREHLNQEEATLQSSQPRWRDSSDQRLTQKKHDPDIHLKNSNVDAVKAAEEMFHEPQRPSVSDAVEKQSVAKKTKPPSATASQPPTLTEEGESIAKVLEWFNRSTDSSNRLDTDSVQDQEESKDDITDSEEEALALRRKQSRDVYTIIQRQQEPKDKRKLYPDDISWGEQSVDLSDVASERSDPQREGPTITVRPFQPGISRDTTYQHRTSGRSSGKAEAIHQSSRSGQAPLQTESNYQSLRSNQAQLQIEATADTNRAISQSKYSVHPTGKNEAIYQQQRPTSATAQRDSPIQSHAPVHSMLKTETTFKALQHKLETQRPGVTRVEDVGLARDPEAGAGLSIREDTRFVQHQNGQTSSHEERPKIANLKSFWERGNAGPRILISRTNVNAEKKTLLDRQTESGHDFREPVEEPQKQVQNFEIRSMNSSLKVYPEDNLPRAQVAEVRKNEDKEKVDNTVVIKYISDDSQAVPENKIPTERSHSFEATSVPDREIASSDVKSPPPSVTTSRFSKKVTEEAIIFSSGVSETAPVPTPTEPAPKIEDRVAETLPESRSLSRTSTPVLPSSPVLQAKQNAQHLENRRERLKQLKSFWETESNARRCRDAESKFNHSSSSTSSLSKRFTKSAFDLRSAGLQYDDDNEEDNCFSPFNMKDKSERVGLGDANFKNLRNFWAGSTLNLKPPTTEEKLYRAKSPPVKPLETTSPSYVDSSQPWKAQANPGYSLRGGEEVSDKSYGRSTNNEKELLSSPSLKTRHRSKDDEWSGTNSRRASVENRGGKGCHRSAGEQDQRKTLPHSQSRRNSEQVAPNSSPSLKSRSGQARRTSMGNTSSGMRRATSMYSLAYRDVEEPASPKPSKKSHEFSPARTRRAPEFGLSFSKKTPEATKPRERSNERRPSRVTDDPEWQQPLARSFIPRDYQHYLGIPERTGTCPVAHPPDTREEVCTSFSSQPECEWTRGSVPPRSSTPVGIEEASGRRGSQGPRPAFSTRTNEDASQESSRSSVSESRTSSRKSSKCDEEDEGPVQRALRRAAARPAFTKSLEDITAVTGADRESEKAKVFSGDVSPVSSSLATSFSDPEHIRKMSKSVPSFLQEDVCTPVPTSVSGSVMSVCSGDFGGVEVQGTIQFTLNYVQKLKEFHIFVVQCKNLAAIDTKRNRSDPYVKSYLIPDKAALGKRKTSVKKKTVNPLFNEILRYRVRIDYLKNQVLNLSVWHHDTFGKNSFLGEVELDLSVWDFNNTQMNYMTLKARTASSTQPTEYRGEMRLAIRYLPQMSYTTMASNSGEVHIWVKDCKNLMSVRGATIDPYVKCFVLPDTSRKSRQKTRVLKRTDCPVFNHTMVYDGFQPEDLREACVELTVWDRDRLANHLLGGLRLGLGTGKSYGALVDWMDSTSQEVALWERMMDSPTEWVEDVLPLRVLMTHVNK